MGMSFLAGFLSQKLARNAIERERGDSEIVGFKSPRLAVNDFWIFR